MNAHLTKTKTDISAPVSEILIAAGIEWKSMVKELQEIIEKGHVSYADCKIAKMYIFLKDLQHHLNPQLYKELCGNLNAICEHIWSQKFIRGDKNIREKTLELSRMFD